MKIDAHQHFWRYNAEEYAWITPEMTSLEQDRLPDDLASLLAQAGIAGTVAVQARQSLAETAWLLSLADRHDFIRGVVGWVELCSPEITAQLDQFARHPKFRGVRHVLQDEPDDAFMLRPDFQRGVRALADYGLTYDILVFPRHLPIARQLVERFPEQPFVIDHLAKPEIRSGQVEPWGREMRRLAEFPNVFCKVSGMVTEAEWAHWSSDDFVSYLDVVFDAFGPERLMFGSDWPVCTLAASYQQVVDLVRSYTDGLSREAQDQVWGETAIRFYRLEREI